MSGRILTRLLELLLAEPRAGQGGIRWTNHPPTLVMGAAAGAWMLAWLYQLIAGLDWVRTLTLLGLLLPIAALAPFTLLFRRPPAVILPFRPTPKGRRQTSQGAPADSIPAVLPLWRLQERIARTGRTDYQVVDESGRLVGVIALEDLPAYEARESLGWLVAADIMREPRSAA